MSTDNQQTKVIFRKWPNGDITALFPELLGDYFTFLSYMHVGQHGDCSPDIIHDTSPATLQEYKPLYDELVSMGYSLKVCKKYTYAMQCKRIESLRSLYDDCKR